MTNYILSIDEIGADALPKVGGKGANLGEMTQAGFNVPPGFCVTTDAYDQFMAGASEDIYAQLVTVSADDLAAAKAVGQAVREQLAILPLPDAVTAAVLAAWRTAGEDAFYAVRSSATAEDLPSASFAGQQDTYLNVSGEENILTQVKACFISLFTDRAILYRMQNGFDHREVKLSVIVQQMVQPEVSGIMFTADPISGHRKLVSIDASWGLGEALVAGLVSSDLYQAHKDTGEIIKRQIAEKDLVIRSLPEGGTEQVRLQGTERTQPALTDAQILELVEIATQIETHYGSPQDIEWAIADGAIYITQSRPITSLYPLPQQYNDEFRVYVSMSHFQMMMDASPPLSISLIRTFLPFGKAEGELESKYVLDLGGRFYGDFSLVLRHPIAKHILPRAFKSIDELGALGIKTVMNDPRLKTGKVKLSLPNIGVVFPIIRQLLAALLRDAPEGATNIANELTHEFFQQKNQLLDEQEDIKDRLRLAVAGFKDVYAPILQWVPKLAAGGIATNLVGKIMRKRADAQDIAAIGRGLTGNIVTEMGLAAGDLADAALASERLASLLSDSSIDALIRLSRAADLPGGGEFLCLWEQFIQAYGVRCTAELDISRPRWADDPASLLAMIVGGLDQRVIGSHRAHHKQLQIEGEKAAERLVALANKGLFGALRARVVSRLVRVSHALWALREHHKFIVIQYMALIRKIFVEVGDQLAMDGKIKDADDVWFLTLPELIDALELDVVLHERIAERRTAFAHYQNLTPPRVMTSEGEVPSVKLGIGNAPQGALLGTAASAGVVEGVSRVVRDPIEDALLPGEILVAPHTDPGWTPLFVNAAGVVVEVGGILSHGSVVAREYGIPAVVSVPDATNLIKTGQRIRVHGDAGYVEILEDEE